MKPFTTFHYLILLGILSLTISCAKHNTPFFEGLPAYSETGENKAGAIINNQEVWYSENIFQSVFSIIENLQVYSYTDRDSMVIRIFGEDESYNSANVSFHLQGLGINSYSDLYSKDSIIVVLDGTQHFGSYSNNNSQYLNGKGKLYIRKIYHEFLYGTIISGTFGFDATTESGDEVTVHYGRFDFLIESNDMHVIE